MKSDAARRTHPDYYEVTVKIRDPSGLRHGWDSLLALRDGVAPVIFDYRNIRILDPSVRVEVLAEIGARHGLVQLALDQCPIGLIN